MKIASRFDEKIKTEKCPICLTISSNFIDFESDPPTFACLKCGNIFIPKYYRDSLDVKELLKKQREKAKFICDCGQDCTNAPGLANHKRSDTCPLKEKE